MKINKKILLTSLGVGLGITGLVSIPIISTSCSNSDQGSQENVYDNFWAKVEACYEYQDMLTKIVNLYTNSNISPSQLQIDLNKYMNTPKGGNPNNKFFPAARLNGSSPNTSYDELKNEAIKLSQSGSSPYEPTFINYTFGNTKFTNSILNESNNTITLNFDSNIISINQAINAYVEYYNIFGSLAEMTPQEIENINKFIKQLSNYITTDNNSIVINYQAIKNNPPKPFYK